MAMFLIVGCQTIEAQLPEETKPEETKSVAKVEKADTDNSIICWKLFKKSVSTSFRVMS